jgi:ceramide glucosyltransferase
MAMSASSTVYLALAAAALIYATLLTLQAYEFRRFVRSRLRNPGPHPLAGRVAVVAPCRGPEPNLQANLRPLFEQDHKNYLLLLVVESLDDAACRPILRLIDAHPHIEARLIVAGRSSASGQKVHNLLAATVDLPEAVTALAFVDSDARPQRDWLRQLVQHLGRPGVAAATAYRWLMPRRATLPNLLAHALDASVIALVGPGRHHLVWGGSWAIRRDVFEACNLRAAWQGTLSDDLVSARLLGRFGRVEFEPGAVVATPIDFHWRSLGGFVRRQYTIGRFYAPAFWAAAGIAACLQQAVFWIGLALPAAAWLCGGGDSAGRMFSGWTGLAMVAAVLLFGLQVLRAGLRQDAARYFAPRQFAAAAAPRMFDVCLGPLVGLLHVGGLASALISRRIEWRGYLYEIATGGKVRIVRYPPTTPKHGQRMRNARARRPQRFRRIW